MPAVPSSLALETIDDGSQIVASEHRNNYTAIQTFANALVTLLGDVAAKGDLLVATANDNLARVAVGANDTVFVADSTQTGGVRWAAALALVNAAATAAIANKLLAADANPAFDILGSGKIEWGAGGASALDTNLYRSAADTLKTDDQFQAVGDVTSKAGATEQIILTSNGSIPLILFGSANDTNLFRSAANTLKTDDQFVATDGITTRVVAGVVSDGSFTVTPASGTIAIDTTNSRIYVRVGSTWKSVTVA